MSNLLGLEEKRPVTGEYDNVELGPDPDAIARAKRGANWFYWLRFDLAYARACAFWV